MNIVEIAIEKIKPYENNPRLNDNAVETVAKSINEFGFQQPIVLDKDYVIVVGHTRYKAALELGYETVPCQIADNLTEDQCRAYRLVDNKVGEFAVWDHEKLNFEIDEIDLDLEEFGFIDLSDINVDGFFEDAEPKTPAEEEKKEVQCPHCGMYFTVE